MEVSMNWNNEVVIESGIDLVMDVIWNRVVLNDNVCDTVLAAGFIAQRVFGEHFVYNGEIINYFVVLTCVTNLELYKVVQCSYTFYGIYVVNEYFIILFEDGVTKLNNFGSCNEMKGNVLTKPSVSKTFCTSKVNNLYCERVKKFCE